MSVSQERLVIVGLVLAGFAGILAKNAQPMAKQACTNVECSCEANGGECFCLELGDGTCTCKIEPQPEPPKPAPFPPKPEPAPDVLPGELDPPKPKVPKATPGVTPGVKEIILHSRDNCPPCDSWWFNERPKFEADGWKVCLHVLGSNESGLSPSFTVEVDEKRFELKGYQTIESVSKVIQ